MNGEIRIPIPGTGTHAGYVSYCEYDRAGRLAEARQSLATGTGCPPWEELTSGEQVIATLEARNWLRAAVDAGLKHATCPDHDGTGGFRPDWCIAPAATLREWMTGHNVTAASLACAVANAAARPAAAEAIQTVLDRGPLTVKTAHLLELCTSIPARFWSALEHDYRTGLAGGRKDTS